MYTVDYFIKKFEAIPSGMWRVGSAGNDGEPRCALGHCGIKTVNGYTNSPGTDESRALSFLLTGDRNHVSVVFSINDDFHAKYNQKTPKERILAALYDVKKKQQPEYKDITAELASKTIVEEVSDLKKELKLA